jgi:hypothetical protein
VLPQAEMAEPGFGVAGRAQWAAKTASRCERTVTYFSHLSVPERLLAILTVCSPLQYISAWLLSVASPWPELCVPHKSPILMVQQHLTNCLLGSFSNWTDDFGELICQQALLALGGLYLRFELRFLAWDYLLLSLPFLGADDAARLADNFFQVRKCCLNPFFASRIRKLIQSKSGSAVRTDWVKALLGATWMAVLNPALFRRYVYFSRVHFWRELFFAKSSYKPI